MQVIVENCSSEQLQETVQRAKDAGRRILDVAVAKIERRSRVSLTSTVTEYSVVSYGEAPIQ